MRVYMDNMYLQGYVPVDVCSYVCAEDTYLHMS